MRRKTKSYMITPCDPDEVVKLELYGGPSDGDTLSVTRRQLLELCDKDEILYLTLKPLPGQERRAVYSSNGPVDRHIETNIGLDFIGYAIPKD